MERKHPLQLWREAAGLSPAQVVILLSQEPGDRVSPQYLRHIENGLYSPGWDLSKRIAKLIGADPATIKDWRELGVA